MQLIEEDSNARRNDRAGQHRWPHRRPTSSPTATRSRCTTSTPTACRRHRRRRRPRRPWRPSARRPRSRCCRCPRPRSSAGWPTSGRRPPPSGSILVDLSTNSPTVVRELGARLATTGHHLVEAPAHRRLARRREPHADVHGRRRRRPRRARAPGARSARSRHVPPRPARARQHDEAGEQPARLRRDLGEPRRPVAVREGRAFRCSGPSRCCAPAARRTSTSTAWSRASTSATGRRASRSSSPRRTWASSSTPAARSASPRRAGSALLQVLVGAVAAGLGDHDWSDLVTAAERQGDVELSWNTD